MTRRGIMKSLFSTAGTISTLSASDLQCPKPTRLASESSPLRYLNWNIYWTGWKGAVDNNYLVGQWIAYSVEPDGRRFAFSSVPGVVGWYLPGQHFPVCVMEGQEMIYPETHQSTVRRMEREAFYKLIRFLRAAEPTVQLTTPALEPIHNPVAVKPDGAN